MAKSNDYKTALSGLSKKLNEEPIKTPIQEVRPVVPKSAPNTKKVGEADETHVNFWGPTDLVKRLKMHSVTSGKSLKQIIVEALEAYLPPL